MKILHTGDLHVKLKQDRRYRKDLIASLKFIVDTIDEHRPEMFVIAGDAFDVKSPTATESAVFSSFIKRILDMDVNIIIIPGNHDTPNHVEEANALKPFQNFQIDKLHIFNKPGIYTVNDVDFMALPYVYHDRDKVLADLYAQHQAYTGSSLYFIGHFWLDTYTTGNANYTPEAKEFMVQESFLRKFNKVKRFMLGHIHNGGEAFPNCVYSGSPYRTKLGEKEPHKFIWLHDELDYKAIEAPVFKLMDINIGTEQDLVMPKMPTEPTIVCLKIKNISANFMGKINDIKRQLEHQGHYVDLDLDLASVKFNSVTKSNVNNAAEFFESYIKMNNLMADSNQIKAVLQEIMSGNITEKTSFFDIKLLGL